MQTPADNRDPGGMVPAAPHHPGGGCAEEQQPCAGSGRAAAEPADAGAAGAESAPDLAALVARYRQLPITDQVEVCGILELLLACLADNAGAGGAIRRVRRRSSGRRRCGAAGRGLSGGSWLWRELRTTGGVCSPAPAGRTGAEVEPRVCPVGCRRPATSCGPIAASPEDDRRPPG
jgi:hypothetical protein